MYQRCRCGETGVPPDVWPRFRGAIAFAAAVNGAAFYFVLDGNAE